MVLESEIMPDRKPQKGRPRELLDIYSGSHDEIPEDIRIKFIEGSLEKNRSAIEAEVQEQTDFLQDLEYKDLISPETFDFIYQSELRKAEEDYLVNRAEGYANDEACEENGLTAYFPSSGYTVIENAAENFGFKDKIERIERLGRHIKARLDNSTYFLSDLGYIGFTIEGRGVAFELEPEDIIRIEADDGSLWQNPDYHWDGTPRAISS